MPYVGIFFYRNITYKLMHCCTRRNDVINKYLNTLPSKQRSSASWTLDRMAGDYGSRLEALVKQNNPGWKPGDAFDTSILDQLDGTLGGVDFRA